MQERSIYKLYICYQLVGNSTSHVQHAFSVVLKIWLEMPLPIVTNLESRASFFPLALCTPEISVVNAVHLATFFHIIPPSPLATTDVPFVHRSPLSWVHFAEARCVVRIADEQGWRQTAGCRRRGETRCIEIRRVVLIVWRRMRTCWLEATKCYRKILAQYGVNVIVTDTSSIILQSAWFIYC